MLKNFLLYFGIVFLTVGIFIYSVVAFAIPEVRPPMIIMIVLFSFLLIICIKKLIKDKKERATKVAFPHKEETTPPIDKQAIQTNSTQNKNPQQYIIHKNTIEKVGGEITKADVPYLIELGYQDVLRKEANTSNPKFHRTDREEDLAFNFSQKYEVQIKNLERSFESPYREEQKTFNYKDKIVLLELALENFEKTKRWCYSKGKGGQIYFDDMWMNLHNSQKECFPYTDIIQERLVFIKSIAAIRQQILDIVNQTPGILQKDIYKFFDTEQKSDVVYAIKDLVKDDCILKEKNGNSYSLTALVSQDIR